MAGGEDRPRTPWRKRLGSIFGRAVRARERARTREATHASDAAQQPVTVAPPAQRDGEAASCRVCYGHHGPLLPNHLIDPCDCKGELKWIHRKCLYNWMEAKPGVGPTRNTCEICKAEIDAKTLLGPLRGDVCDEDAPAQIAFFPFFGKKNISLTM